MIVEKDILEAFQQVLDTKPFNKISVNDIVNRCGIHRNTFYYHFENIPDLIKKMTLNLIDTIVEENGASTASRLIPYYSPLIPRALKHKERILNVYHAVDHDIATDFIRSMSGYAVGRYLEHVTLTPVLSEQDLRALRHYGRSLITGIVIDWFDEGMEYDLYALLDHSHHLLFGGEGEMPLYRPVPKEESEKKK